MIAVTLHWNECRSAIIAGGHRRLRQLQKGRADRYGYDGTDLWTTDIESTGAEIAVAKHLGVYWWDSPSLDYDGDVGEVQVRWTGHPNGKLILHPEDADEAAFFLVRGHMPAYEVAGWIRGGEGKLERFWADPTGKGRHAFFVPTTELNPPEKGITDG